MKYRDFGFSAFKRSIALTVLLFLSLPGQARPITVAVISDLNGSYGSTFYPQLARNIIQRIIQIKPDLVISTGDMVAGQRKPLLSRRQVETLWISFHEVISNPLAEAGIPLAVTPGNHDGAASADFHTERSIFADQWQSRKPKVDFLDDSHFPFYYAFVFANTVFVSVDATLVGPLPRPQMKWLESVLAKADARKANIVLFSHVPLWPFAAGRERDFIGDTKLEQLLQKNGVDLYLSGHHHAFYPGHKDGIFYVSQACIGAGPRPLLGSQVTSGKGFTVIRIDEKRIKVNAYQEPNLSQPLNWGKLPASIHSTVADLQRADRIDPDIDTSFILH